MVYYSIYFLVLIFGFCGVNNCLFLKTEYILMHICGIWENGTDEPICKAGIETQMQRTDMWTRWGEGRWGELGDWD